MSTVTRMESITTTSMEPLYEGGYREIEVTKWAWRCDQCGNVWSRKQWAEACESRRHRMAWVQTYYSGRDPITGKPTHVSTFIRTVIRRERQQTSTVPTRTATESAPTPGGRRTNPPLPYAAFGG